MYGSQIRWRIVTLIHIYDMEIPFLSDLFGPNKRSIQRWYKRFTLTGSVEDNPRVVKESRWPREVVEDVEMYVKRHPTFYIEELQEYLRTQHPGVRNTSLATICRALNFDMKLTRKVLTKAAREAAPEEIRTYYNKLKAIYSYPEQLVFIDETSKDGRDAYRRYARSKRGTKAVVKLPFSRGKRVSILAAMDCRGFFAWKCTSGTFARRRFHHAFSEKIIPHLNPWPLPRSIVIMDNAKIHMFKELEESIHQTGARLLFLPPYSPELNPIEVCFGKLKRWIQRYANLVFPLYPVRVLEVAMRKCTDSREDGAKGLYAHCGYDEFALRDHVFSSTAYLTLETTMPKLI